MKPATATASPVQIGRKSRRKGRAGECEIAGILRDLLGVNAKRRVRQHDGDSDLEGLEGWSVEVKRAKTPAIPAWWRQTVEQASAAQLRPVLFYRVDRREWRAIWPLQAALFPEIADICSLLEPRPHFFQVESGIEAWAMVYRETIEGKS